MGKTTLVSKLIPAPSLVTLDDLESRTEAQSSPKSFLARYPRPVVLDEAQKSPALFDEIKRLIDKKRVPGEFVLTGSATFSTRAGIRESLTGRIGTFELAPLTVAEKLQLSPSSMKTIVDVTSKTLPMPLASFVETMTSGGLPLPGFMRSAEQRRMYWKGYQETSLIRDLPAFFARGYDPDLAHDILKRIV